MPDIITVTLNPALDLSTQTQRIEPGPKLRCDTPRVDPGGGGINVSRFIRLLSGHSLAVVALGGSIGARVEEKLRNEGVTTCTYDLGRETRQSFVVTDETDGREFQFVTSGPVWEQKDEQGILAMIAGLLRGQETIVVSGSQPDGVSPQFVRSLNDLGETVGATMVADVSGEALGEIIKTPQNLRMVRMDKTQARDLSGQDLDDQRDIANYAQQLISMHVAKNVIIDCGAEGAIAANAKGIWAAECPVVDIVSPVVMGDALTGAMALALTDGEPIETALLKGVGMAISAGRVSAFDQLHSEDVLELTKACKVCAL